MFQPSWVTEQCLAFDAFNCCDDEDLLPFKCSHCCTLFVLCYECETLYTDLHDLTQRRFPNSDDYSCPSCSSKFGDIFRDPAHRTAFSEWDAAKLAHLISVPPRDDFIQILIASADQMIHFLSCGMRSTARQRSLEFRTFAESIAVPLGSHASQRDTAYAYSDGRTLKQASQWLATLDPLDRSFATLGVLDRFIPMARGG